MNVEFIREGNVMTSLVLVLSFIIFAVAIPAYLLILKKDVYTLATAVVFGIAVAIVIFILRSYFIRR